MTRAETESRATARRSTIRAIGEEAGRGFVVVVAGLALGGLTSPAQQYLPEAVSSFANSNGGWTMLTFVIVWATRARLPWALLHGVLAFEALIEGYAMISALRGFLYAEPFSSLYAVAAVLAGPVVGCAAPLVRWGRPESRVLGTAVLSAILIADGMSSLVSVGGTTGYVYWISQILLGAGFLAVALIRERPRPRIWLISAGVVALFSVAYPALVRMVLQPSPF